MLGFLKAFLLSLAVLSQFIFISEATVFQPQPTTQHEALSSAVPIPAPTLKPRAAQAYESDTDASLDTCGYDGLGNGITCGTSRRCAYITDESSGNWGPFCCDTDGSGMILWDWESCPTVVTCLDYLDVGNDFLGDASTQTDSSLFW
jgi:hypothetical protein